MGLEDMEWSAWPGEWYLDAGVLLLALALDLVLRELPAAIHPVVWTGKLVSWLESLGPSDGGRTAAFAWGASMAVIVPALSAGLVWVAANGLRELGSIPYLIGGALLLSTTFAVSGLARAASSVQEEMKVGNIAGARLGLESLVSRDASSLSPPLVAAAAIESVAENTTDSYIGPWLAFALFGLPGAFAYRALNTLDSMVGYRGRYEYLGKASARLDDVVNLVLARLGAILILGAGALCRLPVGRGWNGAWKGRHLTESPNAGWTIGAMSGLLGAALEKPGYYRIGHGLGEPCARHIGISIRVAYLVAALGLPVVTCALAMRGVVVG